jgi:ABC-type phosphate/phosphonate transport system substrate-binding protein
MIQTNGVAALPMYNVTPHLAAGWREFLWEVGQRLSAGTGQAALQIVSPDDINLPAFWRRDDLWLSQTCGYPLTHSLDQQVQLVATPIFDAPGCAGPDYSSVMVVRKADRETTLDAYRGRIAAYNDDDSHSGMNAFRHTVAPLARDGRFFGAVVRTGSHLDSLRALAAGDADIAAIDCVTFAFVREHAPLLSEPLRSIGHTRSAPGLPLIASRGIEPDLLDRIRSALDDVVATRRALARRLRLLGFAALPAHAYRAILDIEQQAIDSGYPRLA